MSRFRSFEKVFREADEEAGVSHSKLLAQEKLAALDDIYDEKQVKKAQQPDQFDIDVMRAITKQVVLPTEYESVLVGRYQQARKDKQSNAETLPTVLGSWEDEVEELYGHPSSSSDAASTQLSDARHLLKRQPLAAKLESFSRYFGSDVLNELDDPYDTIIPNADDDDGDAAAPDAELLRVLSLGVPSTPAAPRLQQNAHVPASSETGKASALVAESTRQKLFARFASTLSRGGDDDDAAADGDSEAAPVLSTSEAKAILAQKPSEAASADERRTQKLQQKIAEANLSRHELIALKRKQKMERLRGINPYFDPTLSLRNSRQNRSQVTAGKASFREYHSGLVASLTHALVARQHMNSKPDLTEAELKHFHRPRMTHRDLTKSWQIGVLPHSRPAQTRERSRRHVSAVHAKKQTLALAPGAPHHSHGSSASAKRSQTEVLQSDAANSTFILVEYAEEFPPVVQNYGMASLLVNFYRPSKGQGAADDDDPSGASEADRRAEEEASLQRMTALLARHKLRLPSHVSQLWRLQHSKEQRGRYDHDADIPRLELGQTKLLNPDDESPFLGWDTRDTLQPALVNRLFRTPLFPQQVRPTDFLLVRSRVGADGFEYVLREIPFAFAAGQVEPLRLVPRPPAPPAQAGDFSVTVLPTQRLHYALAIVRILKASEDGVSLAGLQKAVLKFSGDEKRAPHKAAHRELVKDLATRVLGEFRQTDEGDARLFLRDAVLAEPPRGEETLLGDVAAGGAAGGNSLLALSQRVAQVLERYFPHGSAYGAPYHYHPDRLAHAFEPEDVCVVEASAAAEHRMRAQHLLPLDQGFLQHYLHFHSRIKDQLRQLMERIAGRSDGRLAELGEDSLGGRAALQLACRGVLERLLRRAERHFDVARCLRERLLQMPWSTSEALASCVVDRALNTAALFFDPTHGALPGGDGAQLSARLTLQAQHGLNAPYAAMPVGCLGHFPYHSNHPQQPRVLDVQGPGDPSGHGEAFALKRYVHVNSRDVVAQLWQQLRDSSASASASAAAGTKKEDKGLYGTDKDMRRLTKAEAIVILVAFGIDHAKASAMARWDRIHVIREYVQQAEKEGRQIEAFSKYLRDDRASSGGGYGLRRVRRQGANEFGRFGSKEHYEGVCREVWRRMARALSSDDWRSSRDEPPSLEQQRRLRRQQRRERARAGAAAAAAVALAALVEDSDEDDDEDLKYERDQRRLELQQRVADADAAGEAPAPPSADAVVDPSVAERARKRELRRLKREAKERRKQRVREGAMTAEEAEAAFAAEVAEIAAAAASSKAKGAKGGDSDGDAAVGAKRSAAAAAEGDEDEDEDEDDADDMRAMLLARSAGGAPRVSAGGPAPKRPRVEAAQDEAAELRALSQGLATAAAPTAADEDEDEGGPVSSSLHEEARRRQQREEAERAAAEAQRRELKRQQLQSVARPQKVVRRIERSYLADGRCVVTVRFVFDQAAVLRVEAAQAAQQSLRIARRLEPQKMEAHVWRRLRVLQNASGASTSTAQAQALQLSQGGVYVPGQGLVAQVYAVNDYDEEHVAGGFGGSTLGGALSLSLHRPADDDAFAFSHGGGGGRGRRGRGGHGHGALGSPDGFDDGGHDVQVGEEEVARLQQSMTSSRRHKSPAEKIQNARLPHVTLAALLETEIMRLWTQPIAELFRCPVDTASLPTYLSVVAQPIALSDMRHKAVTFQYSSARELTRDVALMASNAEAFNGRESPVTKNARKLLTTLQANLQHHATIFGPHGDVYALLEMLVAKQRAAADAKASQPPLRP